MVMRSGDGPRRRRMIRGTIARIGELAMRYGHPSQLATLDCTSSRRSTVMCALPRATAVTTVYQRDSSSKRPRASVSRWPSALTPRPCARSRRRRESSVARAPWPCTRRRSAMRCSFSSSVRSPSRAVASSSGLMSCRSATRAITVPASVTIGGVTLPAGQRERGGIHGGAHADVRQRRAARDQLGRLDLEPGALRGGVEVGLELRGERVRALAAHVPRLLAHGVGLHAVFDLIELRDARVLLCPSS